MYDSTSTLTSIYMPSTGVTYSTFKSCYYDNKNGVLANTANKYAIDVSLPVLNLFSYLESNF